MMIFFSFFFFSVIVLDGHGNKTQKMPQSNSNQRQWDQVDNKQKKLDGIKAKDKYTAAKSSSESTFSESSKTRGRMPPRLAYIQNAVNGFEREEGETLAKSTLRGGDSSPLPVITPSKRGPAAKNTVDNALSNGAYEVERPPQYLELERLLSNVSEKLGSTPYQRWISSSQSLPPASWPRLAPKPSSRPSSRDGMQPEVAKGVVKGAQGVSVHSKGSIQSPHSPALMNPMHDLMNSIHSIEKQRSQSQHAPINPLQEFMPSEETSDLLPMRGSDFKAPNRTQSAQISSASRVAKMYQAILSPIRSGRQASHTDGSSVRFSPKRKMERSRALYDDFLHKQNIEQIHSTNKADILHDLKNSVLAYENGDPNKEAAKDAEAQHHIVQGKQGWIVKTQDLPQVQSTLRKWVRGEFGKFVPKCALLPEATRCVWDEELDYERKCLKAVQFVIGWWRTLKKGKKMRKWVVSKVKRKHDRLKAHFVVWTRLSCQREHPHPPGSNVRGLMSYWLISWRIIVRNQQIAEEKAKDLKQMWEYLFSKYYFKGWKLYCHVMRRTRRSYRWRCMEPWIAFHNDYWIVKKSYTKHVHKFLLAAFRCLYFFARCSRKLKARAAKLFRLEEASIYELVMPIERFPGYFFLFDPKKIFEKFKRKDWYERRVYRCLYQRLVPLVFPCWKQQYEKGVKYRVVAGAYRRATLSKGFSALEFLMQVDEFGNRVHEEVEKETEERNQSEARKNNMSAIDSDPLKGLEKNIESLSGLVEHENREIMRQMIRDAKRKSMVQTRVDVLGNECQKIDTILADMEKNNRTFEKIESHFQESTFAKKSEQLNLIVEMKAEESIAWTATQMKVAELWMRASDLMSKILDEHAQMAAERVYRLCWLRLRKAAFKIRVRHIFRINHMRRLLSICFHHEKMKRSIYKFYPLRLKFFAMLKWFKEMEYQYTHSTRGLKTLVRHRQDLYMKLSSSLRAFNRTQSFTRSPTVKEFHTPQFVLDRWCERTQSKVARRRIILLFRKRKSIELESRCFDFLKHHVTWRQRMEGPEGAPDRFLAKLASGDLLIWKKNYFSGRSYAELLRFVEKRTKRNSLRVVKRMPRLVEACRRRKARIEERLTHEQRLLMRFFAEIDKETDPNDANSGLAVYEEFPVTYWGSVLNLRRNQTLQLLENCDKVARAGKNEFDSMNIGLGLSSWLFKIRCKKLPELHDTSLPTSKRYWRHIKGLFNLAQQQLVLATR